LREPRPRLPGRLLNMWLLRREAAPEKPAQPPWPEFRVKRWAMEPFRHLWRTVIFPLTWRTAGRTLKTSFFKQVRTWLSNPQKKAQ